MVVIVFEVETECSHPSAMASFFGISNEVVRRSIVMWTCRSRRNCSAWFTLSAWTAISGVSRLVDFRLCSGRLERGLMLKDFKNL